MLESKTVLRVTYNEGKIEMESIFPVIYKVLCIGFEKKWVKWDGLGCGTLSLVGVSLNGMVWVYTNVFEMDI